ncbi:MAG TPA: alpha-glucan family phosphorylase, partial [Methanomicrobiales archaeon]|nr:alpha-glucan family phosphorylase [Methanomicrobiales archaeon]
IQHSIAHLNEGHAAFLLLERIRELVLSGLSFEEAAGVARETSVFTTHTPVPAGTDVFPYPLIDKYFGKYYAHLGISRDAFLALGKNPDEPSKGFNMTAFALRMTRYHNGVSKRHGEVARHMWKDLWPDLPVSRVPIGHVTNGVHIPTWIEPKMELLLDRYLQRDWLIKRDDPSIWEGVDNIPDAELWYIHNWLKRKLVNIVRERARQRWAKEPSNPNLILAEGVMLDPSILTIGFARRFADYKRADLIFNDLQRFKHLLKDRWKPVQFIFAGKAHPNDDSGKQVLQRVFKHALDPDMGGRIAFVENYGEQLAQYMTHGVDLWLNNPLPPMEASGTSGMKAALNGVPQLSILDGWWVEGFNGKNGWAVKHEAEDGDPNKRDADAIYTLLEKDIVPLYYRVSADGIPHGWVQVMKESMKSNAPRFSAQRMVKEYIQQYYSKIFQDFKRA